MLHAIKKYSTFDKKKKKVNSSFELPANFFNRDSIKNFEKKKKKRDDFNGSI